VTNTNPSSGLPLGVAILAILIGIVGFLFLIGGILLLVDISLLGSLSLYGGGLVGGLVLLFVGILLLVVASGLWNQELWVLVLLFALASSLFRYFSGRGSSLLVIVIEVLLLVYLVAVSNHFR